MDEETRVTFRMPNDLAAFLRERAAANHRSLNSEMVHLMRQVQFPDVDADAYRGSRGTLGARLFVVLRFREQARLLSQPRGQGIECDCQESSLENLATRGPDELEQFANLVSAGYYDQSALCRGHFFLLPRRQFRNEALQD